MFIPAQTLILPNQYGMCHGESLYPEPSRFRPERFLGPDKQRDPDTIAFGFGARICPGRHLAQLMCVCPRRTEGIELSYLQPLAQLRFYSISLHHRAPKGRRRQRIPSATQVYDRSDKPPGVLEMSFRPSLRLARRDTS